MDDLYASFIRAIEGLCQSESYKAVFPYAAKINSLTAS
jgi:hypothetical protein